MDLFTVTRNWRVFIAGRRLHHGLFGAWLTALGLLAMFDDRRDFPWRTRDK